MTRGLRFPPLSRFLLLAAALVALAVLVVGDGAPPAGAQSAVELVTNKGQSSSALNHDWSDAFGLIIFTGAGNAGKTYTLTKIRVLQDSAMTNTAAFRAELWSASNTEFVPVEKITDLTITPVDGVSAVDLVAPEGTTLAGNDRYALVVYRLASFSAATWSYSATVSASETSSLGWRLGDNRKAASSPPTSSSTWGDPGDTTFVRIPKITVFGFEGVLPTVTLTSDDADGEIAESAGSVTLTATLSEAAPSGGVSVTLSKASGTATATDDYSLSSATITIAQGDTTGTTTLNIVDDATTEGDETLVLKAAASGHTSGSLSLTIKDNESQAQSATVLVSNMGQTASTSSLSTSNIVWAVRFDTGSNSAGYTLTSVEVVIGASPTESQRDTIRAELWSDNSGPDSKVYDLTVPAHPISAGTVTFTAPANATLSPDTVYWVVPYTTGNFNLIMGNTDSDGEDTGAASGWSIGNVSRFRQSNSPSGGSWGSQTVNTPVLKVQVNGTEAQSPLDLSALTAESSTDGSNFTALTLNPDFAAGTTEYRAAVANDVTHVRLTPTLADTNSSVKVGKSGGTLTTVSSGSASGAIPVDVGANEITVEVTDTNSNTQNYIVTVYRTSADLLVTNLGQEVFTRDRLALTPVAQGFTTGSHAGGYSLRSIDATFEVVGKVSAADAAKVRAELWSAVASGSEAGQPDEKLIDLTPPTSISAGVLTFTAPSNVGLGPNTTFLLLLYLSSDLATGVEIRWTATDQSSEDLGQTGWSVEDEVFSAFDIVNVGRLWTGQANVQHISVNGAEAERQALTGLTLETSTDGSNFTAVTGAEALAPAFDAATAGYRATVGNDVTHVRLTATEANGGRVYIGTTHLHGYDSGTPSDPIPLQVGDTNIGAGAIGIGTLDYTVIVRRVPAGSEWWATFTPGTGTNLVGCSDPSGCASALTDHVVTVGGTDFYFGWVTDNDSNRVTGPNALEIGFVDSDATSIAPNAALKALNFCVGPEEYALTTPLGINSYLWANANLPWVAGAPVSLSIGTSCGTDGATGPGPGDLDPDFSADSILTTAIGSDGDRGFAVARQDDGKIVVAGYSYNGSDQDFAVVRYTSGGVLDPTFGTGGMVVTDFGASRNEEAYAVAIQDDGKIVVAGQAGNGNNWDFAVVRYTADGELDTTFSTDGKAAVHFDNNEYARAVAIQSDGKIVVAGWAEISGQNNNFALASFNADGTPDTSFSTDGKLHTRFGSSNTAIQEATAVAVQSDGKIVVAGNGGNGTNRDFLVARYTTAGVLDTSFGADNDSSGAPDGWRLTPVGSDNDRAYGVAVDGSGNIVLAGETDASGGPDFAVVRYTSTGALDTSFDSDGKVTTGIGSAGDRGRAVRIDANGKIVVGGYSYNGSDQDFAVVRYDTDGSLDTDFHSDGKATAAVGTGNDEAHAMVLDADGNILLAGHSTVGTNLDIALAAFTAGGEPAAILDRGITTTAVGSGNEIAEAVAVQADGKIVLAGYSHNGSDNDFAVVRYDTDGSLDTGFSSDGKVTTAIGSSEDVSRSVAVQADGKIVAAGYSTASGINNFAVARYNADGSLDTGFHSDGKVTKAVGSGHDEARAVAVQSDGKIVPAGYSYNGSNDDFAVVRYNADGTLDTGFGTSGVVTTAIGSGADRAYSVEVQSDGKIVLAGYSNNGSDEDFAVVRYNADGSLDAGFGAGGKVTTAVGSDLDIARSVAIQTDGKIVLAGYSNNGSDSDFALVRYNADGSLDTGFGTGGKVTTAIGSGTDIARSVAIQSDGKIVAAGYSGNYFAVVRYNADGSLDTGFGTGGVVTTVIVSGQDRAYAAAIQPDDNKIVLAGYSVHGSNHDFAVARYLPGEVVPLEEPPAFLVSNAGQTKHTVAYSHGAQGFTTGSESGGYALGSIDVVIGSAPTSTQRDTIRAELWSATTGGAPDEKLADLTVPAHPIAAGTVSFPAPANTTLSASTKYFVHLHSTTSHQLELATTLSDDEDSGGAVGWSIENTAYYVSSGSFIKNTVTPDIAIQITVKGAAAQDATMPEVSLSATPTTVAEGSSVTVTATLSAALSSNVTIPVTVTYGTASTDDHGTLTGIAITSGATTGTGTVTTTPDTMVEDDETFTVSLDTANLPSSVAAGPTTSVQITIDDDDTPAAPTGLDAVPLNATRLALVWTAPAGTLTGYDVHYTSAPSSGSGAVANDAAVQTVSAAAGWFAADPDLRPSSNSQYIYDLTTDTDYRLRVRANSYAGAGDWAFDGVRLEAEVPTNVCVRVSTPSNGKATISYDASFPSQYNSEITQVKGAADTWPARKAHSPDFPTGAAWHARSGDPCRVGALEVPTPGATYDVRFHLVDIWSQVIEKSTDPITVTVWDVPGKPTGVSASTGSSPGELDVSWTAPVSTGFAGNDANVDGDYDDVADDAPASITDYQVRWRVKDTDSSTAGDQPGAWSSGESAGGGDTSHTASGLTPSEEYEVQVRALNGIDPGSDWSDAADGTAGAGATLSTNANLSALTASSSTSSRGSYTALALTPAFGSGTTSYAATVESAVTHARLTPTVEDRGRATVQVGKSGSLATVSSGRASAAIPLDDGANAIIVRVTAEDGNTTRDYTVTITRAPRPTVSLSASPNPVIPEHDPDDPDVKKNTVTITATLSRPFPEVLWIPVTLTAHSADPNPDHGTISVIGISANSLTGTHVMNVWEDRGTRDDTFTVALDTANLPKEVAAGSPASVTVTIQDTDSKAAPGALPNFRVTPKVRYLELTWKKPAARTTHYEVQYKTAAAPNQAGSDGDPATGWISLPRYANEDATTRRVTRLTSGTAYDVRARAMNDQAAGPWATGRGTPK